MRTKRIVLALVMAFFGAASLAQAAGPPAAPPSQVPGSRLAEAALNALCQYLGWFCS